MSKNFPIVIGHGQDLNALHAIALKNSTAMSTLNQQLGLSLTAGTITNVPHSWDHYQCPSQLGPLPMSLTAGTITNVPHSWDHYQCPSQLGPLPMSLTAGTITNVSNSWDHYQCPQWYRMQKVCKEGGGGIKKEVDI